MSYREKHQAQHELVGRVVRFETDWVEEYRVDAQTTLVTSHFGLATTDADRPWLTNVQTTTTCEIRRPIYAVKSVAKTILTPYGGHVRAEIEVDGERFYEKTWTKDYVQPGGATDHLPDDEDAAVAPPPVAAPVAV